MKATELRALDSKTLSAKIDELEAEHFNLRFQAQLGQLDKPLKLRVVRRDIARAKTILNEKKSV